MTRLLVTLFLLAGVAPAVWSQPPAAPADAPYVESDFPVGEGELALPGTLAMPEGDGPFPAVVLVHGSGPHDRDSTIGPNRPLRDIAQGLAARGIATLRYDKRTRVHAAATVSDPDFNLDKEVTGDAVAAVAALQRTPGIDPERVFVFGHSLGGMLAPRILERADGAAGAIMYAAASRSILDLIPEQMERLGPLQGVDPSALAARLETINDLIARVRAGEPAPDAVSMLGAPAAYLREADALDPVAEAGAVSQPLLIMHGGADVQVTSVDRLAWESGFADDSRITFKHYPQLGHLGIAADPDAPLASYMTPGKVDDALIGDIAAWITAH